MNWKGRGGLGNLPVELNLKGLKKLIWEGLGVEQQDGEMHLKSVKQAMGVKG